MSIEVRNPTSDEELDGIWAMLCRAFNFPREDTRFVEQADTDRILAVFVDDEPVAASQIRPFGQWFGGRRVGLGGYSPVGVAPEHRGRGYGSQVTAGQYADLRRRGEVIAGLYPASTHLYRKVGFELAGARVQRSIPARNLQTLPRAPGTVVRRGSLDDAEAVRACYDAVAAGSHGFLDRPDAWWDRVLTRDFDKKHLYVVEGEDGRIVGYVLYRHGPPPRDWGYRIEVDELITDDHQAALALWHTIGSSSTMVHEVRTFGPPEHPLLLLLPEQDLETRLELRWMLRIVDAPAAIAARAYPSSADATVDVDLTDRQCDWNQGRWRLATSGGEARLEPGGSGAVRLGIGALASLYAGYASSRRLAAAGLVSGATPSDLDALDAIFSSPEPWLVDFY